MLQWYVDTQIVCICEPVEAVNGPLSRHSCFIYLNHHTPPSKTFRSDPLNETILHYRAKPTHSLSFQLPTHLLGDSVIIPWVFLIHCTPLISVWATNLQPSTISKNVLVASSACKGKDTACTNNKKIIYSSKRCAEVTNLK